MIPHPTQIIIDDLIGGGTIIRPGMSSTSVTPKDDVLTYDKILQVEKMFQQSETAPMPWHSTVSQIIESPYLNPMRKKYPSGKKDGNKLGKRKRNEHIYVLYKFDGKFMGHKLAVDAVKNRTAKTIGVIDLGERAKIQLLPMTTRGFAKDRHNYYRSFDMPVLRDSFFTKLITIA